MGSFLPSLNRLNPIKPPTRNQPEYSLEGLMLKLKLQYFGHLTYWKKTPILVKVEGRRRRG